MLSRVCLKTLLRRRNLECSHLQQKCRDFSNSTIKLIHNASINRFREKDGNDSSKAEVMDECSDEALSSNSNSRFTGSWTQFSTKKYEKFAKNTSQIIYDFEEERRRLEEGIHEEVEEDEEIILERGVTGVFDVEELVDLLREDNAQDIAVIRVPSDMKYVDYMVIVTSKSQRHINALAQLVRRVYKKKRNKGDLHVILEGKNTEWQALDLGNIALHIMTEETRESYDLETLWTVGAAFDDKCQKEETSYNVYGLPEPLNPFSFVGASSDESKIQITTEK
ncbi:Mitochondrial assembly of ribosomal large subunit protein 1 [Halocaridina rubra]|uniref:Mitochondrial assembly of ribosomal large subunit protein 1 n=1 Tax=Halocaridina rubra TaxID=373956 RepID=A0AAN8WRL6_HALRR